MTLFVSKKRSNQPERSAGRVNAFCLVLHRTEVAFAHDVATVRVRFYRTFSPLLQSC
jgi:hypothetical protein